MQKKMSEARAWKWLLNGFTRHRNSCSFFSGICWALKRATNDPRFNVDVLDVMKRKVNRATDRDNVVYFSEDRRIAFLKRMVKATSKKRKAKQEGDYGSF